jgi:exonuclease SbcC
MKLLNLKLRGFKGIKSGMGVDEVVIDFSALPDGLIAITGENGAGKTTILDNMHPFRLMPYKLRKSPGWSPAAFSFYDQCYGSDALKELTFEMNGTVYQSRVLIDADRKKQEAYLFRDDSGVQWNSPILSAWTPLNDGKSKTYDEKLESIVGSPSLFFTSVFRSQGARNLSDYTRGDIMQVLGELLNTDHIREQGEKCRGAAAALSDDLLVLRTRREQVRLGLVGQADVEAEYVAAIDAADRARVAKKDNIVSVDAARVKVSSLEASVAKREAFGQQLASLRSGLDSVASDLAALDLEHRSSLDSLAADASRRDRELEEMLAGCRREQLSLQTDLENDGMKLKGRTDRLRADIAAAERLVASSADVERDAEMEVAFQNRLLAIEAERSALDVELLKVSDSVAEGIRLGKEINRLDAALAALHHKKSQESGTLCLRIEQALAAVARMDGLDCKGDASGWVNEGCKFIADAVVARDSLPMLRSALAALDVPSPEESGLVAERERVTATHNALRAARPDDSVLRQRVMVLDTERRTVRLGLSELGNVAARQVAVDAADLNISLWQMDLAAVVSEDAAVSERGMQRLVVLADRQAGIENEVRDWKSHCLAARSSALERYESRSTSLIDRRLDLARQELDLVAAIGPDPAPLLNAERSLLSALVAESERLDTEWQRLAVAIGQVNGKLQALEPLRVEGEALEAKETALNSEIADLLLLLKACSNDGIIALELDDSAPSIAAIVNDLLLSCYGPRFSVRLDTQAARADGSLKESFDIVVFDSETDGEQSITDCSGGQLNWLEDALVRGICLFNVHRQDRVFWSLFSDEKDGMLDQEKKRAFFTVKRRALEVGTHRQEFFISQTPDLVALADARIIAGKGGVVVQ